MLEKIASDTGAMETHTGIRFELSNPTPEDVCVEDIAHALALQGRFNGHSMFFWSVGQHSLLVADYLKMREMTDRIVLLGLLHDAAEAYIGDVTSPVKAMCPQVRELEARIMAAVYEGLGVEPSVGFENKIVKNADLAVIGVEAISLLPSGGEWWGLPDMDVKTAFWMQDEDRVIPDAMELVEMTFLKEFYRLKGVL